MAPDRVVVRCRVGYRANAAGRRSMLHGGELDLLACGTHLITEWRGCSHGDASIRSYCASLSSACYQKKKKKVGKVVAFTAGKASLRRCSRHDPRCHSTGPARRAPRPVQRLDRLTLTQTPAPHKTRHLKPHRLARDDRKPPNHAHSPSALSERTHLEPPSRHRPRPASMVPCPAMLVRPGRRHRVRWIPCNAIGSAGRRARCAGDATGHLRRQVGMSRGRKGKAPAKATTPSPPLYPSTEMRDAQIALSERVPHTEGNQAGPSVQPARHHKAKTRRVWGVAWSSRVVRPHHRRPAPPRHPSPRRKPKKRFCLLRDLEKSRSSSR